jgi:hypothetical protein
MFFPSHPGFEIELAYRFSALSMASWMDGLAAKMVFS